MTEESKVVPFIVHVDDQPDELRTWIERVNARGFIQVAAFHPTEVRRSDVERATLVLVDYKLEEWPDGVKYASMRPANGLALLSLLQEELSAVEGGRSPAFALFTAQMSLVARGLVPQAHVVARASNIDWVFEKSIELDRRVEQVEAVAISLNKLQALPGDGEYGEVVVRAWLDLDESAEWHVAAMRDVMHCHPPMHAIATHTSGRSLLRWMLHRILPYPTFLLPIQHVAARLHVTAASLLESIERPEFVKLFGPTEYRGLLAAISGRRWWRAAVEDVAFGLTPDAPGDFRKLQEELCSKVPTLVATSEPREYPVLSPDFEFEKTLATADQIVQLLPDDWPGFADNAWTLRAHLDKSAALKLVSVPLVDEQE